MVSRFHFYMVFNPLFNNDSEFQSQAHEFHSVFRAQCKTTKSMFWGKVKKSTSHARPDVEKLNNLVRMNSKEGRDTFLFLSDFENFWVAKVEEIFSGSMEFRDELIRNNLTLSFYENQDVEVWFKISDFDLLCSGGHETRKKIASLKVDNKFYTETYESLNPYIGGLKYPMIVEQKNTEEYFQKLNSCDNSLRLQTNNPLIEKTAETACLEKTVTSYSIPTSNFKKLPEILQKQIIWSEHLFSALNPSESLSQKHMHEIAFSYLRILEGLLNYTIMTPFKEVARKDLIASANLRLVDAGYSSSNSSREFMKKLEESQTIGEIVTSISRNNWKGVQMSRFFLRSPYERHWFACQDYVVQSLTHLLDHYDITDFRNGIAHLKREDSLMLTSKQALEIRNMIIGVGEKGLINQLIESFPECSITAEEKAS